MLASRQSGAKDPNQSIEEFKLEPRENNVHWLKRLRETHAKAGDGVILLGGASPAHFRVRVAQSHVRNDLLPSYWSLAGLMQDDETFVSVPFDLICDSSEIPPSNAVQSCALSDYKDPKLFPNIAVLRFADNPEFVFAGPEKTPPERSIVDDIKGQRGIVDLAGLLHTWLGYIWAVGRHGNPLLESAGLPSAVFVETAYGIGGIEMTPGLSSASTCPEAIWHAAKWWQSFYAETSKATEGMRANGIVPTGYYAIRQPSAAAVEQEKATSRRANSGGAHG